MVWVGRELPWTETPSPVSGCSKLPPAWPWTLQGLGVHSLSLGKLCQGLPTLISKEFLVAESWSGGTVGTSPQRLLVLGMLAQPERAP